MPGRREMPRALQADLLGRLSTALAAGVDLRKAWRSEIGRVPARWRRQLELVARALDDGSPLAESLAAAGDTFPPLVRGMVAVGDRTGHEAETLRQLSDALARGVRATRELRRSLAGPAFQLAVAVAVVGFLIVMAGMMSHDVLGLGLRGLRGLAVYLAALAAVSAVAAAAFRWAVADWRRHGVTRLVVDLVPVIGPASRASEAAAWCHAASLASGAGLDAGRLVALASTAAPGMAVEATAVEEDLRTGSTLAEALGRTRRFPRRLLENVAVGEATGSTAESLDRIAGQFDDEARLGFEAAAKMAGFLVWAAVAALIATLVVRIFSTYIGAIQAAGRGL